MPRVVRRRGRVFLYFVLVGLVALCVFLPCTANGFVDWDDDKNFLNNLAYRGLGPAQLHWMWTTFHLGPYQPLSWMTLGCDFVVWGMRPFGYHLTNVLLHALGAGLFAFVAARLAAVEPGSGNASKAMGPADAALGVAAGLLWALHPQRVEAVAWVTERREVLSGTLAMLALAFHVRAGRPERDGAPMLLAGIAAMLSKGTAVVLPVLLVLGDLYTTAGPRLAEWAAVSAKSARRHAPLFAGALALGVVAIVGQRGAGAASSLAQLGIGDRLALFGHALGFCAWKTLWPVGLAPLYEMRADLGPVRLSGALGFGVMAAAIALAIRFRARAPAALPLLVSYVALVAPVGGLVQVGFQVAADRYAYAAGWALSLLAAGAVVLVASTRRRVALVAALCLAAPLAAMTVRQGRIWKDSESLWTRVLEVDPASSTAHYEIANLKVTGERGREADLWAEPHFRDAIRLRPDKPEYYRGLGNVLRRTGRLDEAVRTYHDGLNWAPHDGPLVYGLATAQWQEGDRAQAIETLRTLRDCPPVTADSYIVLARALAAAGRGDDAVRAYEEAMAATTDTPAVAPMELAWLLATNPDARVRDGARAVTLAERAAGLAGVLRAQGGTSLRSGLDARIARSMAAALAEAGRFDEAAAGLRLAMPAFGPRQRDEAEGWIGAFAQRRPLREEPAFP